MNKTIKLSQATYIKKILKGLNMEKDRYRRKSNISLNGYNNISLTGLDEELINNIEYSRVINKLIHMMIYTRSNIAFALNRLA